MKESHTNYSKQARGDESDYAHYFAGMDASMQQKIALTTAHFPSHGTIADMGSGSGSGTFDLAQLYKNLNLIGIDINPKMVEYANENYQSDNLQFMVGDVADELLEDNSLAGILNSSVLHHVTSFNGYDKQQITRLLRNQTAQMQAGGVLIIRDFVVPDHGDQHITMMLPTDDGLDTGEVSTLSSAALFKVFAKDFRSSLNLDTPVPYHETKPNNFEITLRFATEFILRKDYRQSWDTELIEEYTYFSQAEFEAEFRKENLRIVVSMPIWNPWIVANRFVNKFSLHDLSGTPLPFPATNYLIVGEKVSSEHGVHLSQESASTIDSSQFLKLKNYRHKETNYVYELVERPNQTIDILPWFESADGQIFIIAKKDFPRPVINAEPTPHLNKAHYSGYITGPISAITEGNTDSVEIVARKILAERGGIASDEIKNISKPQFYFTSPGGIDERVESYLVKIKAWNKPPQQVKNYTPFHSAGVVRELDALQVLRSCAVGGMFDARLEINIYRLLRSLNRSLGTWIGASISPTEQDVNEGFQPAKITSLDSTEQSMFEPINIANEQANFLQIHRATFTEKNSRHESIASAVFEYVVPKHFSKNTVAVIPFLMIECKVYIGIEFRDLPAPQRFSNNSHLACVPAWRLPLNIGDKFSIEPYIHERFTTDLQTGSTKTHELGGSYFTSTGVTPECVYPYAVEIDANALETSSLAFFEIEQLLDHCHQIIDAHLVITLHRLAHALAL